jgi:hypothetical protein
MQRYRNPPPATVPGDRYIRIKLSPEQQRDLDEGKNVDLVIIIEPAIEPPPDPPEAIEMLPLHQYQGRKRRK